MARGSVRDDHRVGGLVRAVWPVGRSSKTRRCRTYSSSSISPRPRPPAVAARAVRAARRGQLRDLPPRQLVQRGAGRAAPTAGGVLMRTGRRWSQTSACSPARCATSSAVGQHQGPRPRRPGVLGSLAVGGLSAPEDSVWVWVPPADSSTAALAGPCRRLPPSLEPRAFRARSRDEVPDDSVTLGRCGSGGRREGWR